MKKIALFAAPLVVSFVALFALLFTSNCSNDFDLVAPWKDIPVVYAILDASKPVQYVRVEKAFLDPAKSALEVGQIPDSLYYDDSKIGVFIQRESNGARVKLQRVDGALEGFPRKSGIFAQSPNWLYKADVTALGGLTPSQKYSVVVERNDNLPAAKATITIPGTFALDFPTPAQKLVFLPGTNANFQFSSDTTSTRFNLSMDLIYRQENINGVFQFRDTLKWFAGSDFRPTNVSGNRILGTAAIVGDNFYTFIGSKLSPPPVGQVRVLETARVILEAGGRELDEFDAIAAANSGISGSEVVPYYTNIENGFGLVTSKRTVAAGPYFFDPRVFNELLSNPNTALLGFKQ